MRSKTILTSVILLAMPISSALAADGLNSGDTAWMIVSTALVMMMTPAGLALFYGGMSRYKNLLNTFAMTFVAYCLASIIWMIWGYSIAFGPDKAGIFGGLQHMFLSGIGVDSLSGSIPTYVFALFQMTFAGITVALVLGCCGSHEVFIMDCFYDIMGYIHLLSGRPLGVGRRLDGKYGRAGFCRRNGGAH